ncbi:MAG: DUF4293 family protein [Chitinophagaceae bacterium]|nr:DUF4293 family protein [Chitinophagaceae bacterium]
MIQRIQSLWLLLAAACAFAGFKFPYYSGTKLNDPVLYELNATSTLLLMVTTIAVGVLALINIFLYKKSITVKALCVGYFTGSGIDLLYYRENHQFCTGTYALTAILHSIIVLAFVMAARE